MSTDIPTPETAEDWKRLDWEITQAYATLESIHAEAISERSKHSTKGHFCELRACIDSICDRSKICRDQIRETSKLFRTAAHNHTEELERALHAERLKVLILENERENWRVSSVCRELSAKLEAEREINKVMKAALTVISTMPLAIPVNQKDEIETSRAALAEVERIRGK